MALFGPDDVLFCTGAASGIGRAVVLQFIDDGIRNIALIDYSEENLSLTQKAVASKNAQVKTLAVKTDVSQPEDVERAMKETVETFNRIDYCVNSAGIGGNPAPTALTPVEDLDQVLGVNLRGLWLCEKAQIKQFLKQDLRALHTGMPHKTRGSIVNIASMAGLVAMPGLAPYGMSKHGVIGLVKSDAAEYAKDFIRVNAMCPGWIDTPILGPVKNEMGPIISSIPMQRLGTPEEIAFSVSFLASDRSSFTTGSTMTVNGGLYA